MSDNTLLTYKGHSMDGVRIANDLWLRVGQIVLPLGFASENSINQIVRRYPDEFGAQECRTVPLPTSGGPQQTRVFSLRGVRLLCLLARTPQAMQFRAWVLDLLQGRIPMPDASARRAEVESTPLSTDARRAFQLVLSWEGTSEQTRAQCLAVLETANGFPLDPAMEELTDDYDMLRVGSRENMRGFTRLRRRAAQHGYSFDAVKANSRRRRAAAQGTLSLPNA